MSCPGSYRHKTNGDSGPPASMKSAHDATWTPFLECLKIHAGSRRWERSPVDRSAAAIPEICKETRTTTFPPIPKRSTSPNRSVNVSDADVARPVESSTCHWSLVVDSRILLRSSFELSNTRIRVEIARPARQRVGTRLRTRRCGRLGSCAPLAGPSQPSKLSSRAHRDLPAP